MPQFFADLHLDRVSFWLGFLAASLFWWLAARLRPLIPIWLKKLRRQVNELQLSNLTAANNAHRRETLRRAQAMHLAAPLFALDEVLIPPRLLAPPADEIGENGDTTSRPIAGQVLPYLPDWPELVSPLGAPVISLAEALQTGRPIAVAGQPGCGKTVSLAHLASQLARRDAALGSLTGAVPVLVHAVDLDLSLLGGKDPLHLLVKAAAGYAGAALQPRLNNFLKSLASLPLEPPAPEPAGAAAGASTPGEASPPPSRRLVLLLDGLDELPPEQVPAYTQYLSALMQAYPNVLPVVTSSFGALDGLTRAGFYPLGVSAWNAAQRDAFLKRWAALWSEHILPAARKDPRAAQAEVDPRLIYSWLTSANGYASPLEWTLRAWSAYAGDMAGGSLASLLRTHLVRSLSGPDLDAVELLAHALLSQGLASLPASEMEQRLTALRPFTPEDGNAPNPPAADQGGTETAGDDEVKPAPSPRPGEEIWQRGQAAGKRAARTLIEGTPGERILNTLTAMGVLVEHSGQQVRFSSPIFLGCLAGLHTSDEEASLLVKHAEWPAAAQALAFAAACSGDSVWIESFVETACPPLCTNLLTAARWLREAPPTAPWRVGILRRMANILQAEALTLGMRARLVTAFYLSQDPSTARLFKGLTSTLSPALRHAGLWGLGALGSSASINDILPRLADQDPAVRQSACLALSALPGEAALNTLYEVLLHGDEHLRQAAAEALSLNQEAGWPLLDKSVDSGDLLTRRAVVFGLARIGQPWADRLLEKLAVEDAQWVVRNAAAEAIEQRTAARPVVPAPLPPTGQSPWLITFASQQGLSPVVDQPNTDLLLLALTSGEPEDRIAALRYLRDMPGEEITAAIEQALNSEQAPVYLALLWRYWTGICQPLTAAPGDHQPAHSQYLHA